jgi:hypothetical protein
MYKIIKYNPKLKQQWDWIVDHSYNGIFQHKRDFIGEPDDECSVIVYKDDTPCAVFPAIYRDNTIVSHPHLSVGGLVYRDISGNAVFLCLQQLKQYYDYKPIIYKRTPTQFHSLAVEDDKWAINNLFGEINSSELSSFVSPIMDNYIVDNYRYTNIDLSPINFRDESEIHDIWDSLVIPNLLKYNTTPTHTSKDILRIYSKFPAYVIGIKATHLKSKKLLGALVIFKYNKCYHVQYSITSSKGRALNALNILHCFMLKHLPSNIVYYNFGKSTEHKGTYLNESLLNYKNSFGSGSFVYETFEY